MRSFIPERRVGGKSQTFSEVEKVKLLSTFGSAELLRFATFATGGVGGVHEITGSGFASVGVGDEHVKCGVGATELVEGDAVGDEGAVFFLYDDADVTLSGGPASEDGDAVVVGNDGADEDAFGARFSDGSRGRCGCCAATSLARRRGLVAARC